jgi:hypothetical protein
LKGFVLSCSPNPPPPSPKKSSKKLQEESAALRQQIGETPQLNLENLLVVASKILRGEFKISLEKITLDASIEGDLGLIRADLRSFLRYLEIEFGREFQVPKSGTLRGLLK